MQETSKQNLKAAGEITCALQTLSVCRFQSGCFPLALSPCWLNCSFLTPYETLLHKGAESHFWRNDVKFCRGKRMLTLYSPKDSIFEQGFSLDFTIAQHAVGHWRNIGSVSPCPSSGPPAAWWWPVPPHTSQPRQLADVDTGVELRHAATFKLLYTAGRKTPPWQSQNLNLPPVFKDSAQRKLTILFMKIICL